MPISLWADYLVAFRRRHNLTQSELAARLGVSPPTVSRWESGVHVPDNASQKALRAQLGAIDTNTEAEWVYRVGATRGVEFLISRGRGVISTSAHARAAQGLASFLVSAFVDATYDLATEPDGAQTAPRQLGLYDGTYKSLQFTTDSKSGAAHATYFIDAWPVLTTDEHVLLHAVAHPHFELPGHTPFAVRDLIFVRR